MSFVYVQLGQECAPRDIWSLHQQPQVNQSVLVCKAIASAWPLLPVTGEISDGWQGEVENVSFV